MRYTFFEILEGGWWIGVLAFCVSLVATPVVRLIAYKAKAVDRPDDLLKPHGRPVAYLGGVAMCLGLLVGLAAHVATLPNLDAHWNDLLVGLAAFRLPDLASNPIWIMTGIAIASVVIMLVGLTDDLVGIGPRKKVLGQTIAACILLAGGTGDRMAMVVFSHVGWTPPPWLLVPVSAFLCLVVVISACNATNLLDGLDGLCGGVTGIIALGFLCLAVFLAAWNRSPHVDTIRVALCLAMAGGVLGFLPYNIPPATIFMGDAGSMLLGFFVATMMALFCQEGNARWLLAASAVFALPILDTALAVVRRLLSGKSIFAGDRSHLYDQLVDRGMSVKQVVVLFYFLAVVAAVVGVTLAVTLRGRYALVIYAGLLVIIWYVFWRLGMIRPNGGRPPSPPPDE